MVSTWSSQPATQYWKWSFIASRMAANLLIDLGKQFVQDVPFYRHLFHSHWRVLEWTSTDLQCQTTSQIHTKNKYANAHLTFFYSYLSLSLSKMSQNRTKDNTQTHIHTTTTPAHSEIKNWNTGYFDVLTISELSCLAPLVLPKLTGCFTDVLLILPILTGCFTDVLLPIIAPLVLPGTTPLLPHHTVLTGGSAWWQKMEIHVQSWPFPSEFAPCLIMLFNWISPCKWLQK